MLKCFDSERPKLQMLQICCLHKQQSEHQLLFFHLKKSLDYEKQLLQNLHCKQQAIWNDCLSVVLISNHAYD
ncbi:hypothetical protein T4A_5124 [Trichinella pseudospiralis]|uniref:Uncharacterized protein n=1 Tax=Trichinella pseudospiralis TaxID=6337 RepID=A0A0V1EJZ5_TRIPS|nr:hypothetical protein T4A_5124 [Trichinella pseudospiralis]